MSTPDAVLVCHNCQFQSPPGFRFCGKCGSPLGNPCSSCGLENPPGFKFCGQCAAPLGPKEGEAAGEASPPSGRVQKPADDAERRQLTVLFCDLVGSTPLSEQLDPEDLRDLVRDYQTAAGEVVERYDGNIAQYLGDGILVYFGYPTAHEDDPQRAVLAGLEMVTAVRGLNDKWRLQQPVAVRIGVHTGFGVAGDVGGKAKREQLVIGRTPNVAARIQSVAEPDTVVVSQDTQQLAEGFFVFESLGPQSLKGISEPVTAFRVVGASDAKARFDVAKQRGLRPMVGRAAELAMLRERWGAAREGHGAAVLLGAEPGVGKSRLVHTITGEAKEQGAAVIGRCSAYSTNAAYHPLGELFRSVLGIADAADAGAFEALSARLAKEGLGGNDAALTLASLIGVPLPEGAVVPPLSPVKHKEVALRLMTGLLLAEAKAHPLLVLVEDLHWADPSTLGFVEALAGALAEAPILVLLTARPTFQAPWGDKAAIAAVQLGRLGDDDARAIVLDIAGKRMPESVVARILEKADGVPLYVEEMTKAILESGILVEKADGFELKKPLEAPAVPATLRDSLMARLDRLGPAKETAQLASCIGRVFSMDLLAAIAPVDPRFLRRLIQQLLGAELIYREEASSRYEVFKFKHALIQDTAHDSMLRSRRREVHENIARTLEQRFAEIAKNDPGLLARHFEEAGLVEPAVRYLHKSGQRAKERGAHLEAITDFAHGVELLSALPDAPLRNRLELELRATMGGSLVATRGYTDPEFERCIRRAWELCGALDDPPEAFTILFWLYNFHIAVATRDTTEESARMVAEWARKHPDPARDITAHYATGTTLFYQGRFAEARLELQRGLRTYAPEQHLHLVRVFGDDHGLFSQVYIAWATRNMGEFDVAEGRLQNLLAMAEGWQDPLAMCLALLCAIAHHHENGQLDETEAAANRCIALAHENGFPYWLFTALIGRGWARALRGDLDGGLADIDQGIGFFQFIQQKCAQPYWLGYKAQALLAGKRADEAAAVLDVALGICDVSHDMHYRPMLQALYGDVEMERGKLDEARAWLEKAMAGSREMGAPGYEIYVALRAAQLDVRTGHEDAARSGLAAALERVQMKGKASRYALEARELLGGLLD